jgi:ATP-grasp in the biosynthetic pathway with Ter operon
MTKCSLCTIDIEPPLAGLTVVVVADTPKIASAVIDSLPTQLPYFLVGDRGVAFLRRSRRCREYFMNDLSLEEDNKADFVRTIEQVRSANSNIFLIPADDSANRIVHSTLDRLGVSTYPMPDSGSFEMLNDKWRFHRYCSELGIRVPKAINLNSKTDIDFDQVCATAGLPFVLKPTNKSNGLGVSVICSREQLHREVLANRKYDFSPLIVQSFIPGLDIDISVLSEGGHIKHFAIQTRKEKMLCFVQNEELVKSTGAIIRGLRYTGVIHIDARLHAASREIFLVEANPRFWASLDEATLCGLNFVRAGMHTFMGLEGPDPTTIFGVSSPSVRRILADIATCRQSYLRLPAQQRLRVRRIIGISIRKLLRRDAAVLLQRYIFQKKVEGRRRGHTFIQQDSDLTPRLPPRRKPRAVSCAEHCRIK